MTQVNRQSKGATAPDTCISGLCTHDTHTEVVNKGRFTPLDGKLICVLLATQFP